MEKLLLTIVFTLCISFGVMAQVSKVASQTSTIVKETTNPVTKQTAPEGHYCDYCKQNYPESHFPCIMKSIKGKVNAKTGQVEFVEGGPIGGIVVKGGKNPGGSMNIITNSNGEVEINNAKPGNYKFTVTLPTNNSLERQAGTPIGGIIVKGGKNPGGQMFTLVTNANGEVVLNNLEAGNYKFVVMSPTAKEKSSPLYEAPNNTANNPIFKSN